MNKGILSLVLLIVNCSAEGHRMRNFVCYYCQEGADIFPDVISHLCQAHSSEDVKFRSLKLNEITGKFGYRTKHFAGTTASSYNITVTGDNELNIVPRKPETVEQNTCLEEHYSTTDKPEITSDDTISELYDIIPVVIEKLKQCGQLDLYMKWCNLVATNRFPLDNICYLLFLDVVQWFSSSQTSQMRYFQEETLNFWKVGYRLFHGKFLRFMGGPKNSGQIVAGDKEERYCLPENSKVNFAVPSTKTLNQDKLVPLHPGVFLDNIKVITENIGTKSIKIGIDDLTWTWQAGDQTVDIHKSKTNPGGHSGGSWFLHQDQSAVCMFGGERKYSKTPSLSNDLWKVDFRNNWKLLHNGSEIENMPEARQLAAGCGIQNYYFVVFGGLGKGEKVLGDTWVYYMHDDKWYKLEEIQKKLEVNVEANSTLNPPARGDAAVWCDSGHNMVVFGGFGSDNNLRHDMWVFSMSSLTWREVESSTKLPNDPDFVKHLSDFPMGRSGATTWQSGNNLYMYGGNVQHQNLRSKHLNTGHSGDLWLYNLQEDTWKFLNGFKGVCTEAGHFGVKDRPSSENRPGCRRRAAAWVDCRGNLWMFGGDGADASQGSISVVQKSKLLSDLWLYDVEKNVWIWKGGLKAGDQKGQFGKQGEAGGDFLPGSRAEVIAWSRGNYFWLFGGVGHDVNGQGGYLDDIWLLNVDKDPIMRPDRINGGSVFGIIFLGLVMVVAVLVLFCFLRGYIKESAKKSSIEVKYSPLELAEQ